MWTLLCKKNCLVREKDKKKGIYQNYRIRINSLYTESWVYNNQKVCYEFNNLWVYKYEVYKLYLLFGSF